MRLRTLTILRVEPRAPSASSRAPVPTADSMYGKTRVYPGCVGRCITWWCIPGYATQVVYTRVHYAHYASLGVYIPPGYER